MNLPDQVSRLRPPAPAVLRDAEILWQDNERVVWRGACGSGDAAGCKALAISLLGNPPRRASVERLKHEFSLRDDLHPDWALRPRELVADRDGALLLLDDPGGRPLEGLLDVAFDTGRFLRLAVAMAQAVAQMHARGLVHKDLKPAHVFVDGDAQVRLTGFGIATRLVRERHAAGPPEEIAGTLAYMAPEQTGRMNRSVDARSDLYALGVTLYRVLVGSLPFTAADAMGWVHAHIARSAMPPLERVGAAAPVSAIVMRLLAKTPEDRYQTASGLLADLTHCLAQWERSGQISEFALGVHDTAQVLRIPEKLYGREREIATLLSSFDRVVVGAGPELILVSGYSGIGKSSVVSELHRAIVPARGWFAAGKFEQFRRDIPYATFAQALQSLLRQVLARSPAEVAEWRTRLRRALAGEGELMARIVPDLVLLAGADPPVPELPPQKAQARFRRVFRRLLAAFAQEQQPLVLFLDDLQWMDPASLAMLVDIASHAELRHLMIVGAYRDNEVDLSHPLLRGAEEIRGSGTPVRRMVLAPLSLQHVGTMLADTLRCHVDDARPLADIVHEKTAGNPFFVIQFLTTLVEEKLLTPDAEDGSWRPDLERIQAKGYSDNVVELVVAKLGRLDASARQALGELACLGSGARFATLERLYGDGAPAIHAALWPAVRDGLLVRMPGRYAFVHDRVQEASYSLVRPASRPEVHLRIGRALLAAMQADEIIDVVSHLNRGVALVNDPEERLRLADLNLQAGRRAKASTAYASACTYLAEGVALLPEDAWDTSYPLSLALHLEQAECEFLGGSAEAVETLVADVLLHGRTRVDRASAYRLRIDLHVMRSEYPQAVAAALECLREFGIDMPAHPSRAQVDAEYAKVWRNLDERSVESLVDLPRMSDPDMQAAMGVLALLNSPAYFTDASLVRLHLCHMVNLTLTHGLSDASPHALALLGRRYAWFDLPAGWHVARYTDAYRFGKLACDLVDKLELPAARAKVDFSMGLSAVWTQPVDVAVDALRSAHRAAVEGGDVTIACYTAHHLLADLLLRGDPLDDVWPEAERALDLVRKAHFADVADVVTVQQRFIENLRGRTAGFATFGGSDFDQASFEARLGGASMTMMVCLYWTLQLQARFLFGALRDAAIARANADAVLASADGHVMQIDHCFYGLLVACASCARLPIEAGAEVNGQIEANLQRLSNWAERGGVLFADRLALARAEVARVQGRELEAERHYREGIRLATEHRFTQNEALGNELAARFYAARGFDDFALLHLRKARDGYRRWGAEGKVRHLLQEWPALAQDERGAIALDTIGAALEQFDLATVVRVSQAVSGEIVLERMLETLMRTAIEHAGAERGLLLLADGERRRAAAEATTRGATVAVRQRDPAMGEPPLPHTILDRVAATLEPVVLDDACTQAPHAMDPYVQERRVRSLLCLPLVKQGRLVGILYLENNLAAGVFWPTRLALLKLIASQAAIALENARLYRELAERESRIRRLVEANIVGIFIWDTAGAIIEANDAFLALIGHDRDALTQGQLRWTQLTPPEWAERDRLHFGPALLASGTLQPYEKEFLRSDGTRVPVLLGAALFEDGGRQGVAFVLDLSERKRAEEEARDRQRIHHEMQMRLADSNRLASIGQLTASIVHEINQPIAALVTNAHTCVRRLDQEIPNIQGGVEAARRLIRDANRASDVVSRLRALFTRREDVSDWVDLNEAAREVVALSAAALQEVGVTVRCEFAEDLPRVLGDRVQLQQVMMNLVRNAADAMRAVPDGPRCLDIRTLRDAQGRAQLMVEDTGVGIDAEQAGKLFDAFFTTKAGGMGVGLSVSRSIVERHRGTLWAEPRAGGRGACFAFALPTRDEPRAEQ